MPSPFTGMNPYLEQTDVWWDFHYSFVPALSDALCPQVSPNFIMRINKYEGIQEKQVYLEIKDQPNREVVAVIEMLTPIIKMPGPDRERYLAKLALLLLLRGTAYFIEIDLLRGWSRMPSEQMPDCDYCVIVSRAEDRPEAGFWPIQLRERLPIIPIPLREPRTEARLDLQEVLHGVCDRAYDNDYIYEGTPQPPLGLEDAAWAASILSQSSGANS